MGKTLGTSKKHGSPVGGETRRKIWVPLSLGKKKVRGEKGNRGKKYKTTQNSIE